MPSIKNRFCHCPGVDVTQSMRLTTWDIGGRQLAATFRLVWLSRIRYANIEACNNDDRMEEQDKSWKRLRTR